MDTEVTLNQQQLAPSSATVRPVEEFSGHDNAAAFGHILHASLDDHAESSDANTYAPLLAEQFASIVYFSEMAVDGHGGRPSTHHGTAGSFPGAEPVCSTRGGRTSTRPWRIPAVNRNPKK